MSDVRRMDGSDAEAVLELIQLAFAEQAGRIDPPSSMNNLTVIDVINHMETASVWGIEHNLQMIGCLFGTSQNDALYLSKLSVHPNARGQGVAGRLMTTAEIFAKDDGFAWLEVIARVELLENHRLFAHLGFEQFAEGRHDGYDRTTELHFRKPV
jgi:GNAT superfamily N-acetyltransferase